MGSGRNLLALAALSLASTVSTLVAVEVGLRIYEGALFSTQHRIAGARQRWQSSFWVHDPLLGWRMRSHSRVLGAHLGWDDETTIPGTGAESVVSTLDHGIRSNGGTAELPDSPVILATGNSFTFGGRVSDQHSWPAHLERLLGIRVLNGGVSAYGLDQSVLRAEQLAPLVEPDLLIVSFIADDIRRNATSARGGAAKPFFSVEGKGLRLENVPIPAPKQEMDAFRRIFGYSFLADALMSRLAYAYWHQGVTEETAGDGLRIACLLMGQLRELAERTDLPVLVLGQADGVFHPRPLALVEETLACARSQGLETLDLNPVLRGVFERDPSRRDEFYFGHMTPAGNRFVAEVLAEVARELLKQAKQREPPR